MNLELYNKVRAVPEEAKKTIGKGRLKGFTDINPMWRIKVLTEQFGPCGIGWKYEIACREFHEGANGVCAVFTDINLYVKYNGEWSEAIPGTGGATFVAKEANGLHTSDECVKMATTDALSVACKALGIGADVYWEKDSNKYDQEGEPPAPKFFCKECGAEILTAKKGDKIITPKELADWSVANYGAVLCTKCRKLAKAATAGDPSETGF